MTVYTPGGPCLTRLQHEQQLFQKQLQEKSNPLSAKSLQDITAGRTPKDTVSASAVSPPDATEKTVQSYSSSHGRNLDIAV